MITDTPITDNTSEDHNVAGEDEGRSSQKSLQAMKAYFDGKFRSLKRELSRDAEESEKKREKLEKAVDFK